VVPDIVIRHVSPGVICEDGESTFHPRNVLWSVLDQQVDVFGEPGGAVSDHGKSADEDVACPGRDYGTTSRPGACMTAAPSTGREAIMSLATGTRLNTYEILGPLGAGGMGEVYRARDVSRGATMPASPANSMGRGPSTLHV
jgi:hypothetical protein